MNQLIPAWSRRESAAYTLSCAYSNRACRLSKALLAAVSGKPGTANRSRISRLLALSDRNGKQWSVVTRVLIAESAAMEANHQAWMAQQWKGIAGESGA
jgi:hypothetical protein